MKIIKTAKYIEKISQFDDYNSMESKDDYNAFEEREVFRDQEGREKEYEGTDEYLTIEPEFTNGELDGYALVEHGVYPDSSVLAGQERRSIIGFADTAEELKQQNPDAEVLDRSSKTGLMMPSGPPEGFDPADVGERWEEDY